MKEQQTSRFTLRLPSGLRKRIQDAAERNGRTETAEIVARLEEAPALELLHQLLRENNELKSMIRQLTLDRD